MYKAYKWLWKEYEKGVETYNQLLRDKKAMDKDNSRLKQERDKQKENILRMERILTYVEEQVTELQAKQRCEPTP